MHRSDPALMVPAASSHTQGRGHAPVGRIFTRAEPECDGLDDFDEARAELRTSGHNLTSVLMNPRVSAFDNLFDEFETEQSAPMDRSNAVVFPEVDLRNVKQRLDALGERFERFVINHTRRPELMISVPTAEDVAKCFRQVPEMFFRHDFRLEDPDTFESTLGSRAFSHFDERLTTYLDLVEVALLRQISSRSKDFFRALTDIQQLRKRVSEAIVNVHTLRRKVRSVNEHVVTGALRVPALSKRHSNLVALHDKLEVVQQVLQARDTIKYLLEQGNFLTALDVVREAKELYDRDLVGIHVLTSVNQELEQQFAVVCDVMAEKFVSMIDDTMSDFDDASAGISQPTSALFGDLFLPVVLGLLAAGRMEGALETYKERSSENLRIIVKTVVCEYMTDFDPTLPVPDPDEQVVTGTDNTPFTQKVRAMDPDNFVTCVSVCFEHLAQAICRCASVTTLLCELLEDPVDHKADNGDANALDRSDDITEVETRRLCEVEGVRELCERIPVSARLQLRTTCKSVCMSLCDLATRSMSQLIARRQQVNARLSYSRMKRLWQTTMRFIGIVDSVSGAGEYSLRNTMIGQARLFLDQQHETNTQNLINTLDCERWTQCDVSPERQRAVDKLTSGKAFMQDDVADAGETEEKADEGTNGSWSGNGETKKRQPMEVIIDGKQFKVVWSVLLSLEVVMSYLDVALNFPPVTSDVVTKIVDVLELFDKRTFKLLLNAEALQSTARLKVISAKHLALAAQSISLVSRILPHIRAALMAHIPAKHHNVSLKNIDRVAQDYRTHHNKLLVKLVSIIGDVIDSLAVRLATFDWDRFQGQSEYFSEVERSVSTLHKVLSQNLPPEQVQDVFSRIFIMLNRSVYAHFESVMPTTKTGRQRILDELTHLLTSLSRLSGTDTSVLNLEETFRRRYSK